MAAVSQRAATQDIDALLGADGASARSPLARWKKPAIALGLAAIGLLAIGYFPARRAARLDPIEASRLE